MFNRFEFPALFDRLVQTIFSAKIETSEVLDDKYNGIDMGKGK